MNNFISACRQLIYWQTKKDTTPRLVYYKNRYVVTVFYSDKILNKIGAEIIL